MCHMINVNAKTPSCIYVITILNIHKIAESAMSRSFFSILFTILRSETFFFVWFSLILDTFKFKNCGDIHF